MSDFDLEAFAKECDERRASGLIPQPEESGLDRVELPSLASGERLSTSSDRVGKGGLVRQRCTDARSKSRVVKSASGQVGKRTRVRPRSEHSRRKRQAREFKKLKGKIGIHRATESRQRVPHASNFAGPSVNARLCFYPEQLLTKDDRCSEVMAAFYEGHYLDNEFLEVSDRANVSNPSGEPGKGQGVFARKHIPSGTWVCPYLGNVRVSRCPDEEKCQYDMKLRDDVYVCARGWRYDVAYLQGDRSTGEACDSDLSLRRSGIKSDQACPPNYARYVNSLSKAQLDAGMKFNCEFVSTEEKSDEIFIQTTRDIAAGEELLADYGDEFEIA